MFNLKVQLDKKSTYMPIGKVAVTGCEALSSGKTDNAGRVRIKWYLRISVF